MTRNAPLPARYWRCGWVRVQAARRVFRHHYACLVAAWADARETRQRWRAANPAAADLGTVGAS